MNCQTETPLQGRRILIVEDDFLVGQALTCVLELAGATVLGPIGWLDEAIAYIKADRGPIHAAVLDINLHGERSYPIADVLQALNVPFIFATGYGTDSLDVDYAQHVRVQKPVDHDDLLEKLVAV
jgi:DNA-binding response OmpR family regulator